MTIRWAYAFVDRPAAHFDEACAFWVAATSSDLSARRGVDGEFATLLPHKGDAYLKLQAVGSAGGSHLDLVVDDVRGYVDGAVGLGARVVDDHDTWVVLASPVGELFCLVPWRGEQRFGDPLARVLMGQDDMAFWRSLTGWAGRPNGVLSPTAGVPVGIGPRHDGAALELFGALTPHRDNGAEVLAVGPVWTVLRDPVGGVYCMADRRGKSHLRGLP